MIQHYIVHLVIDDDNNDDTQSEAYVRKVLKEAPWDEYHMQWKTIDVERDEVPF